MIFDDVDRFLNHVNHDNHCKM